MSDPRKAAIAAISASQLAVRPYHGLIFLCGGKTDINATAAPPCSIRDVIAKRLAYSTGSIYSRVRMAEDIQDWRDGGVYQELITFEKHLAELASVIVIALESEGSIAELGVFSTIEHHQDKLLVFVEESHYASDSFIKLGILDFLEIEKRNRPEVYRWLREPGNPVGFDHEAVEGFANEILESVKARAEKPSGGGRFSSENWLHRTLLILELIGLFQAVERSEVLEYLSDLRISVDQKMLAQHLFVLERLGLIDKVAKSGLRLLVRTDNKRFIDFGKSTKDFDWDSISFDVANYYKHFSKKRFRALQSLSQGGSQ